MFYRIKNALLLSLTLALAGLVSAAAQDDFEFWPGAQYDASVPTLEDVVGHKSGDRVTSHAQMIRYFEALAAHAPDQVRITEYAKTWEGRALIYVAISSAENIARLDQVDGDMRALHDARITDQATADNLIAGLPATLWLAYSVHGNEISSTDAAILTAHHLLAAQNDPRTTEILSNTIVFLDPLQNPDGRDRFIHQFEIAEGLVPDSDRLSAEHNEPWPGGRTNHYYFDMNRDWIALTQPETVGRIAALRQHLPLVFVDLHEMGGDSSYYFAPEAVPFNPHLTGNQRTSLDLFGTNNARWFDTFGFDYFTREVYDAFYPGYGASWPAYYGAIAMTYEQASSRGLVYRRQGGDDLHFRDTVRHHFVTSLSTAEVVSKNRQLLLDDFYAYGATAISEAEGDDGRVIIIPRQRDYSAADKLAGLLAAQGVDVMEATSGFRACRTDYAAGSYVIDTAQPAKRLIRVLMDEQVDMEAGFLAEQEARRERNLPDQIYDVTGWSLPVMFNVDTARCGNVPSGEFVAVERLVKPASVTNPDAQMAYLVPWGTVGSLRLLAGALRQGLVVKSPDLKFTLGGREYPAGTLVLILADNPDDLGDRLQALARSTGAEVVGTSSSWITEGPNFGSRNTVTIRAPRVAIAWDRPTGSSAAGNTRFIIERQFDYPVTAIRTAQLAGADLSRYDVLILPEASFFGGGGGYGGVLGKRGADNLRNWVRAGGTLISLGSATRFLADPNFNLISSRREDAVHENGDGDKGAKDGGNGAKGAGGGGGRGAGGPGGAGGAAGGPPQPATVKGKLFTSPDDLAKAIIPERESPDSVAGVLVRADVDPDHWMSAGLASSLNVLIRGRDIYTPVTLDKGRNIASFAGPDEVLVSGYLWEENRVQLAYKPFVIVEPQGRGMVIAFTQDPNVRAYLDGLNMIFANAIFRGSAHARPLR